MNEINDGKDLKDRNDRNDRPNQEPILPALDRVMRLLRRRPAAGQHAGRGVFRLLSLIQETPGMSTRELAERLDVRPSSLNEKLARLEEEDILRRVRDAGDQRIFLLELLPKGEAHLNEIRAERKRMNDAIGSILTEAEGKALTGLLQKLGDGLESKIKLTANEDPYPNRGRQGWR